MDEELKAYLDTRFADIDDRFAAINDALGQVRADLLVRMNDQHERLINSLNTLRTDFHDTKDFLLRDAATRGRNWLDLEERVAKLERRDDT